MLYPRSLSEDVRQRAFRATNGELAVHFSDASAFLQACRTSNADVLGWELWIVDHAWGSTQVPVSAPGRWCGGIPTRDEAVLCIFEGSGDIEETEKQLTALDLEGSVQPEWLSFVRVNFALND